MSNRRGLRKGVQTPRCPLRVKNERVDGFANDPPIFRAAIKHSCGLRAAQGSPELCAFVQLHANVSCNAIISDRASGGLHVQPRDMEVCIGLTMLRGEGERGGGRVANAAI